MTQTEKLNAIVNAWNSLKVVLDAYVDKSIRVDLTHNGRGYGLVIDINSIIQD